MTTTLGRRMRRRLALVASVAAAVVAATLVPASAATSPAPAPAPTSSTRAWAVTAPPVPGARRYDATVPASVRQAAVVTASSWSSTTGTMRLYDRPVGGAWRLVTTWPVRLGYTGLVVAEKRVQGSGKTPAGLFTITSTFGRQANPGTRMPYTVVGTDHWWVQDRRSAFYNEMRRGSQGGFARTTSGANGSEHLWYMGTKYDYVTVVDFNRPDPVVGRGSGIFVHAHGTLSTGCITLRYDRDRALVRWLDPAMSPRIVIGTTSWLAAAPA